ncbi:MAG: hypothetical protein JXB25_12375 [Deltaproteobacteria bacterium]|nr:hypothetical protein [Deltaproteobacteria bacterium]
MRRFLAAIGCLIGAGLVSPALLRADATEALQKVAAFYTPAGYRLRSGIRSADEVESVNRVDYALHKKRLKLFRGSLLKGEPVESVTVTVITGDPAVVQAYHQAKREEFEALDVRMARQEGRLDAVRKTQTRERLTKQTLVFRPLSDHSWMWASGDWYSSKYQTLSQQGTLEFKKTVHFGAHAELKVLTDQGLVVSEANFLEEKTGPEGIGDGVVRALNSAGDVEELLSRVRQAAQLFLGQAVTADDETVQLLQVSAAPSNLDADGKAQARIRVRTLEQQTGRPETAKPLAGRQVSLAILAEAGITPGRLDKTSLVTGADGTATALFTAPEAATLKESRIRTARIEAACEGFNPDQAPIALNIYQDLSLAAEHAILPAGPDYANTLTFSFGAPGENLTTTAYQAIVTSSSGQGAFATPAQRAGGQAGTAQLKFAAVPRSPNTLYYHWAGPQPRDAAVAETVTVEIPQLRYRQSVTFSVGVDLTIQSARIPWQGPFFPFLLIPIRVEVADRFHPDADLAALFQTFAIDPEIHVRQTAYRAPPILTGLPGDELAQGEQLVAAASRFVERASGPSEAGATSIHDLHSSVPVKDKEGRWLLMSRENAGFSRTVEDAYPSVVPMRRGTFTYSVAFDPKFKGDASDTGHELTLDPVEVSLLGVREGRLGLFLMPTLKAILSLHGGVGKTLGLAEITLKVRNGDLRGAVVDAGVMLAGETAGNWAGDKMKNAYRTAVKDHYKARIAAALGKPVEQLTARETSLALRLAKPYKLAAWVETVTGWAVEQAAAEGLDTVVPGQGRIGPPAFPETWLSLLVASAWAAAPAVPNSDPIAAALDFVQLLVKGYGPETGLLVVTRPGLSRLVARNAKGESLKPAPRSVFGGTDPQAALFEGKQAVVIPFDAGTTLTLEMEGRGSPVRLYKVLPGGTNAGVLDYQGQPWKKTLSIRGDRVRPQ